MYTSNELNAVELSPTKKDYYQVWNELLDVAGKLSERWDPASTNESDPGVVLLKVLTAVADKLSYNIDANTLEAFMPSAAQESSMRKLCEMLGYSMRFYASATTTARITYQGDYFPPTTTGSIKIDRFTNLKDAEGTINYITLDDITLDSTQRSKTVTCIEGELVTCETSVGNYITLEHLDDNKRFYLPERQVASNVGAIFVSRRNLDTFWTQVDNLNTCLLGQPVFKFGYDSYLGLPYLEFPEDIGTLIGTGLEIKFIRTKGVKGNIAVSTLKTLDKPLSWSIESATSDTISSGEIIEGAEEIPEDWLDINNYVVTNLAAARDGKDPETIDEAYWNFQKTIGTFDTLVTCRDYMNKIYKMTQSAVSTTPLVSNVIVSDIRDDVNRAYSLCTLTNGGVEYISKAHTNSTALFAPDSLPDSSKDDAKIEYFDLMLYPFVATNGLNTQAEYENSFKYSSDHIQTIKSNLKDSQTIAHRFVNPEESEIVCIKVYFQLSARLSTTAKVTALEAAEVELAAHRALFRDFNMRNMAFGEELPYDSILRTLEGADARIKNVSLDDPKLYVAVCTKDGKEYQITGNPIFHLYDDAEKAKQFYLDLVLRNVLAGKVSLLNYNNKFSSNFQDSPYPKGLASTHTTASKLMEGREHKLVFSEDSATQLTLQTTSTQAGLVDVEVNKGNLVFTPKTLAHLSTDAGALELVLNAYQEPDATELEQINLADAAKVIESLKIKLYEPGASTEYYLIEYTPTWESSVYTGLEATVYKEGTRIDINGVTDFIADPLLAMPEDKLLPLKICTIPFNNTATTKKIDKATFELHLNDHSLNIDTNKNLNRGLLSKVYLDFNWVADDLEVTEPAGYAKLPLVEDSSSLEIMNPKTFIPVPFDSEDTENKLLSSKLTVADMDLPESVDDEILITVKPYWKGVNLSEEILDLNNCILQLSGPDLLIKDITVGSTNQWQLASLSLRAGEVSDTYNFQITPKGSAISYDTSASLQIKLPTGTLASNVELSDGCAYGDALLPGNTNMLKFPLTISYNGTNYIRTIDLTSSELANWLTARDVLKVNNRLENALFGDSSSKLEFEGLSAAIQQDTENAGNIKLYCTAQLKYTLVHDSVEYTTTFELDLPAITIAVSLVADTREEAVLDSYILKLQFTEEDIFEYTNFIRFSNFGLGCNLDIFNQVLTTGYERISILSSFFADNDYFAKAYQIKLKKNETGNTDISYRILTKANELAGVIPLDTFISNADQPLEIECGVDGLDKLLVQALIPSTITWPDETPIITFAVNDPELEKHITYPTFLEVGSPYITLNTSEALTELPTDLAAITLASSADLFGNNQTDADEESRIGLPEPTKMTSAFQIDTSLISPEEPLTLSSNEVIQFRAPNLKTLATYPAYVNYYLHLNPAVNAYAQNNSDCPAAPATMYSLIEFFEGGPTGYTETPTWNKRKCWEEKLASLPELEKFMTYKFTTPDSSTSLSPEEAKANGDYARAIRKCGAVFDKDASGKYTLFVPTAGEEIPANHTYYGMELTSSNFANFMQWLQKTRGNITYYSDVTEGTPTELVRDRAIHGIYTKSRANVSREPGYLIDTACCKYTLTESFPTGTSLADLYVPRLWTSNTNEHTKDGLGANVTLNGIPADAEYQLKTGEYLLISYSSSEGREDGSTVVKNTAYSAGTIIKANFELIDSVEHARVSTYNKTSNFGPWTLPDTNKTVLTSADVGGPIAGMYTLGATEQIELRDKIEVKLNGEVVNLYWELKNPQTDSFGYEHFPATKDKPYILQPGEYLYYTDASKENMAYYGSGSQIEVGESTPDLKRLASSNKISAEAINELGLVSAIPWTEFSLAATTNAAITIKEYQYITLIEEDSLESIEFCEAGTTAITSTPTRVKSAKYTVNGLSGDLPTLAIGDSSCWEVSSKLDISMSATRPQVLAVHQTSTGQEVARDIICLWGNKELINSDGARETKEIITQVYTPLLSVDGDITSSTDGFVETVPPEVTLAKAKDLARRQLGDKKDDDPYTEDSYSSYSDEYDEVSYNIQSALTLEALQDIDIQDIKSDLEALLVLKSGEEAPDDPETEDLTEAEVDRGSILALSYTTDANGYPNDLLADTDSQPKDGEWESNYGQYLKTDEKYFLEDLLFTPQEVQYTTDSGQSAIYHMPPNNSIFTISNSNSIYKIVSEANAPAIYQLTDTDPSTWIKVVGLRINIYPAVPQVEDDTAESTVTTGLTPATLALYASTDLMNATGDISFKNANGISDVVEFKACQRNELRTSDGRLFVPSTNDIGFTALDLTRHSDRIKPYLSLNIIVPEDSFGLVTFFYDSSSNPNTKVYLQPLFEDASNKLTIFNHTDAVGVENWWSAADSDIFNENGSVWVDDNKYYLRQGLNTVKIPASCTLAIYTTLNTTATLLLSDVQLVLTEQQLNPKLGFAQAGATFNMTKEYILATDEEISTSINAANTAKSTYTMLLTTQKQCQSELNALLGISSGTIDYSQVGMKVAELASVAEQLKVAAENASEEEEEILALKYVPTQIVNDKYYGLYITEEEVYNRIKELDPNYEFFYTGQISANYGLDLNALDPTDTLLVAKNWFDSQNVNNKFIVSEIDTRHLSNYVVVSKFSRS